MNPQIAVIGSLTLDSLIYKDRASEDRVGGTVYYSSLALANLGAKVCSYPILSNDNGELLFKLHNKNIDIYPTFSKETTTYENVFSNDKMDKCEYKLMGKAFPYKFNNDFRAIADCSFVHLGPLSNWEMPLDFIKKLSDVNPALSLDIQGYLRESELDLQTLRKIILYIRVLKLNIFELQKVTNIKNYYDAIAEISTWGPTEILITLGNEGALLWHEGKTTYIQPEKTLKLVDTTGCGDTFMAAYLMARSKKENPVKSAQFGTYIAAKKIGLRGPYKYGSEILY